MTALDILGLTASCLTTGSFIPQVWRTWKTRDVRGISLAAYSIISVGVVLWLIYGLFINDLPLILGNAVAICLTFSIVVMKIVFSRKK